MSLYLRNNDLEQSRRIARILTGRTIFAIAAQDLSPTQEGRLTLALDDGSVVEIEALSDGAVAVTVDGPGELIT